jgi:hypothetical protein
LVGILFFLNKGLQLFIPQMARHYKQGKYTPTNPKKYAGNVSDIIYRSSWELKFFKWADSNPSVILWNSETTVVPYICGTDGQQHRYFVDCTMKIKDSSGNTKVYLVEIKPHAQTLPPKKSRNTKRYLEETMTYIKNQSKWKAATEFADRVGAKFIVLTEKHLNV